MSNTRGNIILLHYTYSDRTEKPTRPHYLYSREKKGKRDPAGRVRSRMSDTERNRLASYLLQLLSFLPCVPKKPLTSSYLHEGKGGGALSTARLGGYSSSYLNLWIGKGPIRSPTAQVENRGGRPGKHVRKKRKLITYA